MTPKKDVMGIGATLGNGRMVHDGRYDEKQERMKQYGFTRDVRDLGGI
jgi:hypothetical protein